MDVWFWVNWWEGQSNCIREWWQHCNVNCRNVSIFIGFFLSHPNFAPLSHCITWARGSNSLKITWYEKDYESWTLTAELQRRIQAMEMVLPQDSMHLIQRPWHQLESLCQDPPGNQTTRRPPDHRKEMQIAVVWSCLPFIKSGQNHLARQWKGEEDKGDRRRGGKTTSANGQP